MVWETGVQSQVESYQRLKEWHLMPPCLTLSIIRYVWRVKWSNPGKGVAPTPTPWCSSYWKRSLWLALDYGCQLYIFFTLFMKNSDTRYILRGNNGLKVIYHHRLNKNVWSFQNVTKYNRYLKKVKDYNGWNIVITTKMKTLVRVH